MTDEWEDVQLLPYVWGKLGVSTEVNDGYEYRVQRRRKCEPMPPLEIFDQVFVHGWGWVIVRKYSYNLGEFTGAYTTASGVKFGQYPVVAITEIRRQNGFKWEKK